MKEVVEIKHGLELKAPDPRDFSLSGVFGAIDVSIIPNTDWLQTQPIKIKNQHATDFCTAFSLAAVKEDQEGVELSPEWVFMQIKKLRGDPNGYGGDLNSGCKVAVKLGIPEQRLVPFTVDNESRAFLINPANYPDVSASAKEHISQSSFRVDGPYDVFDNIRAALWANRNENRSVYTGSMWYHDWTVCAGGIIPTYPVSGGVGHAYKIMNGQKIINGVPYLIIQNSGGPGIGDKGLFYMPREVVNRELKFGAYMFKDMPRDVAENLHLQAIGENNNFFTELWALIKKYLTL